MEIQLYQFQSRHLSNILFPCIQSFFLEKIKCRCQQIQQEEKPFDRTPTLALSTTSRVIITISTNQDNDQQHDSHWRPQIDKSYKLESEPVFSLKAMISAHNQRDSGGFIIPQVIHLGRILVSTYSSYIFRYIYRSTI